MHAQQNNIVKDMVFHNLNSAQMAGIEMEMMCLPNQRVNIVQKVIDALVERRFSAQQVTIKTRSVKLNAKSAPLDISVLAHLIVFQNVDKISTALLP